MPLSRDEIIDQAYAELETVLAELKAARKILARDWENLSPRDRSAASRTVKALESRRQALTETIEMNLVNEPRASATGHDEPRPSGTD